MTPSQPEEHANSRQDGSPNDLNPQVYEALRAIAARYLASDARRITLTPTVLVHEAWVRLGGETTQNGQEHLKASLARAMRHILVDRARSARAQHRHLTVTSSVFAIEEPELDLEALDLALGRLEEQDQRCARVIELQFFGGLKQQEIADLLQTSLRTVQGDWAYARSWLLRELDK